MPTEATTTEAAKPADTTPVSGSREAEAAKIESEYDNEQRAAAFLKDNPLNFGTPDEEDDPEPKEEAEVKEEAAEPKPDKAAAEAKTGEEAESQEEDEDVDILAKLRADSEARRSKAEVGQASQKAERENIELKARLEETVKQLEEFRKDPTGWMTAADYEALTKRILGEKNAPEPNSALEAKLDAVMARLDKTETARAEQEQQVSRQQGQRAAETKYAEMVGTAEVEDEKGVPQKGVLQYPNLAKLPTADRIRLAYQVVSAAGSEVLDDATIAGYSEKHLQQLLRKLGRQTDGAEEADPTKKKPRRGKPGAKTLTNRQSADSPARAVAETDEEKRDRLVLEETDAFLENYRNENDADS